MLSVSMRSKPVNSSSSAAAAPETTTTGDWADAAYFSDNMDEDVKWVRFPPQGGVQAFHPPPVPLALTLPIFLDKCEVTRFSSWTWCSSCSSSCSSCSSFFFSSSSKKMVKKGWVLHRGETLSLSWFWSCMCLFYMCLFTSAFSGGKGWWTEPRRSSWSRAWSGARRPARLATCSTASTSTGSGRGWKKTEIIPWLFSLGVGWSEGEVWKFSFTHQQFGRSLQEMRWIHKDFRSRLYCALKSSCPTGCPPHNGVLRDAGGSLQLPILHWRSFPSLPFPPFHWPPQSSRAGASEFKSGALYMRPTFYIFAHTSLQLNASGNNWSWLQFMKLVLLAKLKHIWRENHPRPLTKPRSGSVLGFLSFINPTSQNFI